MLKLRIICIASLIVLGILMAFTVFRPMISGEKYSTVVRESIIQTPNEYIIQFNISNKEGRDTTYIINWSTGGEVYTETSVSLRTGRIYTHIHHVYPDTAKEGKVRLTIYKEGEAVLFEDCTYYTNFD